MQILRSGYGGRSIYYRIRGSLPQYDVLFEIKEKHKRGLRGGYSSAGMFKMQPLRSHGYMTVEASVVVPVILLIAMSLIMIFLHLYEREFLRSEMYVQAYSIPYHSTKCDEDIVAYLNTFQTKAEYMFGNHESRADCSRGQMSFKGSLDYKVKDDFEIIHEVGKCTERLRRWQLYEDIAEK